ncbi:RNA polymerase sigma-70 factor (family 1) [Pedobacter africanus]|uniref:RNA polymerase sigma-70 factor (ECF subfamily) n=1 Tax=Pedobacter africanus TaxID=151894 RepID=A0ACC6L4D0_9SPHI|nr:RNA polymerase sigma-70 factor [Pedobacter africanus]MDR6786505.1 RNA polymerase sigma-70 factor (ECF subfamily) [Pedobacter africanus]
MADYSKYTDHELLTLIKKGDEQAYAVVFRKYWDKLLVVAGRRLNDQDEAEEVLQDIFLNLWKRRQKLELRVGFDHYFAVALKFEIINRLARQQRESSRNENYTRTITSLVQDASGNFDLELLRTELEASIQALPPKCQLVFRMSREKDMTNKEIAADLGISEKAVEKHVGAAIKTLRTKFGQYLPIFLIFLSK